jgi:predicted transglutaminase-like cysteine proteinase
MRRFIIMMLTVMAMLFLAGFAFAASTDDPGIQKREAIQQKRIDQGVKSGQLTPKETGKLERQQTKIKQDEERMKADGKLTPQERRKLKREQNRANRNIYRKKHNEREVDVK